MRRALFMILFCASTYAFEEQPDCSGVNRWAATMAFAHLKNEGIINNEKLDFDKTKSERLASQKINDDLYIQIHKITFTKKSGNTITVIT